jgi:hypothetical protein
MHPTKRFNAPIVSWPGSTIPISTKPQALNLLSPLLRFKEDGSPASNQYNFSSAASASSPKVLIDL